MVWTGLGWVGLGLEFRRFWGIWSDNLLAVSRKIRRGL